MTLSNAERCRRYRERHDVDTVIEEIQDLRRDMSTLRDMMSTCVDTVIEIKQWLTRTKRDRQRGNGPKTNRILLELLEEIRWVRYQIALGNVVSPTPPSLKNLPSEDESYKKDSPTLPTEAYPQGGLAHPKPTRRSTNGSGRSAATLDWQPSDKHRWLVHQNHRDDAWLDDVTDRYRCWLANAKRPHTDLEAGFRNFIKARIDDEQRKSPPAKLSPVDKLYLGAARAAEAWEKRERARLALDEPLLDC